MFWPIFIATLIVVIGGLAAKFGTSWFRGDSKWHIDWTEYIAGVTLAVLVVIPSVVFVGKAWSTAEALMYQEFRNGVETGVPVQVEECRPGYPSDDEWSGRSNCTHQYNSGVTYRYKDWYWETVSDGVDSKGNPKTKQVHKYRWKDAYIYHPYATKEYHYGITDSLGGSYQFPDSYVKDGEGYQGGDIPANIPRGDPAQWLDAQKHLDEGDPRPVTRIFEYKNYILAAQAAELKKYAEDIKKFKEAGILPDHTKNINGEPLYGDSNSYADKASFVGLTVENEADWQRSLMGFNAALGTDLQGDLHVVFIDGDLVDDPTTYLNALKAYWLGDDFGRRALAKNAIIVVAGVQGTEITWAAASTGMPRGNEVMLESIARALPGTHFVPVSVLGSPRTVVTPATGDEDDTVEISYSKPSGVLESVILKENKFKRACMDCADDGDQVGYSDLVSQIEPQWWQWTIMIVIIAILTSVYWMLASTRRLFDWLPWVKRSSGSRSTYRY